MSEISKEELMAFTEANSKSAIALDKVADRLQDILHNQEKIMTSLTNGISDSIVKGVTDNYNATHKETLSALNRLELSNKEINETLTTKLPGTLMEKINNSDIAKDIDHAKLIMSAVGLIVVIAVVIIKFFFNPPIVTQDQIKQLIASRPPVVEQQVTGVEK